MRAAQDKIRSTFESVLLVVGLCMVVYIVLELRDKNSLSDIQDLFDSEYPRADDLHKDYMKYYKSGKILRQQEKNFLETKKEADDKDLQHLEHLHIFQIAHSQNANWQCLPPPMFVWVHLLVARSR